MNNTPSTQDHQSVAEGVRAACIEEAIRAYEQAGISGLCHEGRFEAAISALRMLDLENLFQGGDEAERPSVS